MGDRAAPGAAPCSFCLQAGAHTQAGALSMNPLHRQIQQRFSFVSSHCGKRIGLDDAAGLQASEHDLDSALYKANCKQKLVFSSHIAKPCLK